MRDRAIIVLAAGKGTRMKSRLLKVLHPLGGKPILSHIMDTIQPLAERKMIVVGYQAHMVEESLSREGFSFIHQERQLGTGDALLSCKENLEDFQGIVMVLSGDVPLLRRETLIDLLQEHQREGRGATLVTMILENPKGYGRIIRDSKGDFVAIREERDATQEESLIKEVNGGIYCFEREPLFKALEKIHPGNEQGEYYLTDVFSLFIEEGLSCSTFQIGDPAEVMGINHRLHLAQAERELRRRINKRHLLAGVMMMDPSNTYIEEGVVIGMDTVIHPNTFLKGETVIGERSSIGPQTTIIDSHIGDEVTIDNSVVKESLIESNTIIGPYAHIRPGSRVVSRAKVGNFVEIKNSCIDEGSKVSHLTYVGDTLVGPGSNIGAGTVIANYDGEKKHRTTIGAGSFLGSNCTLVAPLTLGEGARVGAGAVVTKDVRPNTLVIGVPATEYVVKREGHNNP